MAKGREVPWLARSTRTGVWHAYWYDKEARQRRGQSLATKDADQAQARFKDWLDHGEILRAPKKERANALSVDAVLEDYMREHVEENVADVSRCRSCEKNLLAYFGGMALSDIGVPECRKYRKHRAGANDGTIRRELVHLTAAINHAKKWRRLDDMTRLPVIELPPQPDARGHWLFEDELERLRAAADQETRDFIDVLYYTGARRGTVVDLTLGQIDREANQIRLNPQDRKTTKKRRPVVPIDPAMQPAITRRSEAALADPNRELFPGTDRTWHRKFVAAAEAAGLRDLPERGTRPAGALVVHTIRHTRATHLLQKGVTPWTVSNLLGDTLTTVVRTYGHHCPSHLTEIFAQKEVV